jgi:hypothetical protein
MNKYLQKICIVVLLIISVTFNSCTDNNRKKSEKQLKDLFSMLLVIEIYNRIQVKPCREYYGQPNSLLLFPEYYNKFLNSNKYATLVMGDSTMDISTRYNGYLSVDSYSIAIGGNTACDVLEQLSLVSMTADNIVYSTNDGNGGLRGVDIDIIRRTNNEVITAIKQKLKPSKIVVVLLHPTMLRNFDSKRKLVNKNFVDDNPDVCSILPDQLFTLDSNGLPSSGDMIDSIHYSEKISFGIKQLIKDQCSINL